jgi:hypothetical protein
MSTLTVANLQGTPTTSNVITIPAGHTLRSASVGGIYLPGSVIQVTQVVKTDTFSAAANGTWTDITGLTLNITPKYVTSQILVMMSVVGGSTGTTPKIRLLRNGSAIAVPSAAGSRQLATMGTTMVVDANQTTTMAMNFIDNPATTSAVTYKLQINSDNTVTAYINRSVTDSDNSTGGRYISSITLMEIGV